MLQCLIISQDPYRSRRACFYTNHHCFIGQEAMAALSELLETLLKRSVMNAASKNAGERKLIPDYTNCRVNHSLVFCG